MNDIPSTTHSLHRFGYDDAWAALAGAAGASDDQVARIISERRGQWRVASVRGEAIAVGSGRLLRAIDDELTERPAVGDWVIMRPFEGGDAPRVVELLLDRRTRIARKAPGRAAREQIVAANVDLVFVVCALGDDLRERRIQRFVAIAANGGAQPVVLLNKADLVDDPGPLVARVRACAPGIDVIAVSASTGLGMDAIACHLRTGTTAAMLGTSGAGKSTLVNVWLGSAVLATGGVREDGKGRHTTTSRQLMVLPNGAVVIDTPGLREVGLGAAEEERTGAFDDLAALAQRCRFSDCRHVAEPGCAIRDAIACGEVGSDRVTQWQRLRDEQADLQRRTDERLARSTKAEDRVLARALQHRLRDKGRI